MEVKAKRRKRRTADRWPDRLNLKVLHQNRPTSNPYGPGCDYAKEVQTLNVEAVMRDLKELVRTCRTGGPLTSDVTDPCSSV